MLALLCVAMSPHPAIICIDEPNSFLHPGAAKQLLKILSLYNNQYIISTHSSDLIRTVQADAINLVVRAKGESTVRRVDLSRIDHARQVLHELGVSMSDVLGAEKIVWVEGETEELTFPQLIRATGTVALPSFLAVRATGDFSKKGRDPKMVWDIYRKLSMASATLPTTVAFSFDSEGLAAQQMDDLRRASRNSVHFLPRRTYENYLLHPAALAHVVMSNLQVGETAILEADVSAWIEENADQYSAFSRQSDTRQWLERADMASLFAKLFQEITDGKLEYRKTFHSRLLTEWLLEQDKGFLEELIQYVSRFADLRTSGDQNMPLEEVSSSSS